MGKLQDPVTVRLVLPDILVAYCVLSAPTGMSGLTAETVTVSGPREQVPNASQEISQTLIVSSPDQATLPIGAHRLSEGVPTDRKNGSGISAGVVSTIDGEVQTRDLHFPLLILPHPHVESLAIVRESVRHPLFPLFADIVVGGAHSTCRTSVGRG